MLYGEHLHADEETVKCRCGVTATAEIVDQLGVSCGWFCRQCAARKRRELQKLEKLARAIVKKKRP